MRIVQTEKWKWCIVLYNLAYASNKIEKLKSLKVWPKSHYKDTQFLRITGLRCATIIMVNKDLRILFRKFCDR